MDGMIIIGHRSSKSTFGANKKGKNDRPGRKMKKQKKLHPTLNSRNKKSKSARPGRQMKKQKKYFHPTLNSRKEKSSGEPWRKMKKQLWPMVLIFTHIFLPSSSFKNFL